MKKTISIICAITIIINILSMFNLAAAETRAIAIYEQSASHNSFSTAQEIQQDYTLSGRITTSSEQDYYSVTFPDSAR